MTEDRESYWQTVLEEYARDPEYVADQMAVAITEEAARTMKECGITKAELAERMGVSRAYVTKVFNSPPNLTLKTVAALALALGLRPSVRFEPDAACPPDAAVPPAPSAR